MALLTAMLILIAFSLVFADQIYGFYLTTKTGGTTWNGDYYAARSRVTWDNHTGAFSSFSGFTVTHEPKKLLGRGYVTFNNKFPDTYKAEYYFVPKYYNILSDLWSIGPGFRHIHVTQGDI